jgi:hypothetical protein
VYLGKGTRTRRGFQVGGVHNVGLLCTCGTNCTGNGGGDIAVLCCFHCTTPRAMDCWLCMVLHHLHHHPGSGRHLDYCISNEWKLKNDWHFVELVILEHLHPHLVCLSFFLL